LERDFKARSEKCTFHRWKSFDKEILAKQKSCITAVNSILKRKKKKIQTKKKIRKPGCSVI